MRSIREIVRERASFLEKEVINMAFFLAPFPVPRDLLLGICDLFFLTLRERERGIVDLSGLFALRSVLFFFSLVREKLVAAAAARVFTLIIGRFFFFLLCEAAAAALFL